MSSSTNRSTFVRCVNSLRSLLEALALGAQDPADIFQSRNAWMQKCGDACEIPTETSATDSLQEAKPAPVE